MYQWYLLESLGLRHELSKALVIPNHVEEHSKQLRAFVIAVLIFLLLLFSLLVLHIDSSSHHIKPNSVSKVALTNVSRVFQYTKCVKICCSFEIPKHHLIRGQEALKNTVFTYVNFTSLPCISYAIPRNIPNRVWKKPAEQIKASNRKYKMKVMDLFV